MGMAEEIRERVAAAQAAQAERERQIAEGWEATKQTIDNLVPAIVDTLFELGFKVSWSQGDNIRTDEHQWNIVLTRGGDQPRSMEIQVISDETWELVGIEEKRKTKTVVDKTLPPEDTDGKEVIRHEWAINDHKYAEVLLNLTADELRAQVVEDLTRQLLVE